MEKKKNYEKIEQNLLDLGFSKYHYGTVRNIYSNEKYLAMVVTGRFWYEGSLLDQPIPFKGEILNMMMVHSLEKIRKADICPIWLRKNVSLDISVGINASRIGAKIHVFGYLTGKLWDYYISHRYSPEMSAFDGMIKNQKLEREFVLMSRSGHDDKVKYNTVDGYLNYLKSMIDFDPKTEYVYDHIVKKSIELFKFGVADAASRRLIMARASYSFGFHGDEIMLIDEAHTPYTADYWDAELPSRPTRPGSTEPTSLRATFLRGWIDRYDISKVNSDIIDLASEDYVAMYKRFTGNYFLNLWLQSKYQSMLTYDFSDYTINN